MRQWKLANPEKVREYRRRWHKTAAYKAYQAAYKKRLRQGPRRAEVLAKQKVRYDRNRERTIAAKRAGGAGLTPEQVAAIYRRAKGKCAICRKPHARLFIDHCHRTGAIRGVLCVGCNTFVGYLEKRKALIARAIQYTGKSYK
jgi:hypothetical protein